MPQFYPITKSNRLYLNSSLAQFSFLNAYVDENDMSKLIKI